MSISKSKSAVRDRIKKEKKQYTKVQLDYFSGEVIDTLVQLDCFHKAQTILAYYSMEDEVKTHSLIDRLVGDKRIILPVVDGKQLLLESTLLLIKWNVQNTGFLSQKEKILPKLMR